MPRVFNLNGDEWDWAQERPGWQARGAWVGQRIGGELIGASLYELDPGERLFPYHTHHANEEWLLVVAGRPTLRTPDGEDELREGDVVAFPRGDEGLHQVLNGTDEPVRVLLLSTKLAPDVVAYPDSGKVGVRDATGDRILLARPGPTLDYWEGED
ncbi:MAG TPA: cupin domain-containing protein [Gaiellaceae bacterium]|nr:cupin domain-containing protein [Gaiellaceae bacterium]